ncbi:MAG: sugar phosphate isomerase/epimerase [Pseudomonadota bacterium]
MKLSLFASAWAFGGFAACQREVESGLFDGVEGAPPETAVQARERARTRVPYIAEICSGGSYSPASSVSVDRHFQDFRSQVTLAVESNALFCSCLIGSDSWPLPVAIDFFGRALAFGREAGTELCVETHRSRPTFHPWVTAELLRALPELRLTCDFSHWCVVCERLPDDESVLELAISRARHVHARVGYAQGPQVPDPRAPEYEPELLAHEAWWRRIALAARERRQDSLTVTPEFGPDGYLQQAPFSKRPVADLAELNRWMAIRQRAKLGELLASGNAEPG